MTTTTALEAVCKRMAACYRSVYGEAIRDIFLYGSYARGDSSPYSDIDFAAIVHGERQPLQEKLKKVWDDATDIDLDYDVVVSPTVIPADEFDKYADILPYYRNIRQEGRKIG
ncbi:MAG: nucleotidyltransferase domain-containing protein [Schwartzia sp.]|nr:nucleotidyltransferase domain-containing protein [Schwartzia sp. (in: firmicutes)]